MLLGTVQPAEGTVNSQGEVFQKVIADFSLSIPTVTCPSNMGLIGHDRGPLLFNGCIVKPGYVFNPISLSSIDVLRAGGRPDRWLLCDSY